jgi:hypothetical protein
MSLKKDILYLGQFMYCHFQILPNRFHGPNLNRSSRDSQDIRINFAVKTHLNEKHYPGTPDLRSRICSGLHSRHHIRISERPEKGWKTISKGMAGNYHDSGNLFYHFLFEQDYLADRLRIKNSKGVS